LVLLKNDRDKNIFLYLARQVQPDDSESVQSINRCDYKTTRLFAARSITSYS